MTKCETVEYHTWEGIKARCLRPQDKDYPRYGGRGITICEEWINDFDAFYAYVGPRPKGKTLGRINNDKNYEPGNVKWESRKEQASNRRNSVFVIYRGERITASEASRRMKMPKTTFFKKLRRGKFLFPTAKY